MIDLLELQNSEVALVALRRSGLPLNEIAGFQVKHLHLPGGDVEIVRGEGRVRSRTQKSIALFVNAQKPRCLLQLDPGIDLLFSEMIFDHLNGLLFEVLLRLVEPALHGGDRDPQEIADLPVGEIVDVEERGGQAHPVRQPGEDVRNGLLPLPGLKRLPRLVHRMRQFVQQLLVARGVERFHPVRPAPLPHTAEVGGNPPQPARKLDGVS